MLRTTAFLELPRVADTTRVAVLGLVSEAIGHAAAVRTHTMPDAAAAAEHLGALQALIERAMQKLHKRAGKLVAATGSHEDATLANELGALFAHVGTLVAFVGSKTSTAAEQHALAGACGHCCH